MTTSSRRTLKKLLQHMCNSTIKKRLTSGKIKSKIPIYLSNKYQEIVGKTKDIIVYPMNTIETPCGRKNVLYADFIASGRPSPTIENFIAKQIYTKYSNTHSNSTNGIQMKNEIENVRKIIRKHYHLDDRYEVLFKGSGSTDCINFLLNCLDYTQYQQVHIFITLYEHYSNHLPFVELCKANTRKFYLHIIPISSSHEIDIEWLEERINQIINTRRNRSNSNRLFQKKTLVMASIIHCSNLTGYFLPMRKIKKVFDSLCSYKHICHYFFTDMACSSPYTKIDGKMYDAIFISPHKYIGGVGTPGLLIAKTCLFQKNHPIHPGGSCVKQTAFNQVEYATNIETRESAGTPAIIGIIKIGQCLLLKEKYWTYIHINENILSNIIQIFGRKMKEIHGEDFYWIDYPKHVQRLPIFSFNHQQMHYNFLVVLLNDFFGIQSRGGKSCVGLFMDDLRKKKDIEGLCRISFHWTMSKRDVYYILNAVEYVLLHGKRYVQFYSYEKTDNLWKCKYPESLRNEIKRCKSLTLPSQATAN